MPGTPPVEVSAPTKWYVGFDCATKTFAFSISKVDLRTATARARIKEQTLAALELLRRAKTLAASDPVKAGQLLEKIAPAVDALDAETREFIRIMDGETVDLVPGVADDDIPTVQRVRAVVRYIKTRVRPAIEKFIPPEEPFRAVVEFQMGPNAKARVVASSLITLFAEEDVIIVGPSLKNKVHACEEGRLCYFTPRYSSAYSANKAQAKFNFLKLEEVFGTNIPATKPASLRGHIADSFMQKIGHIVHGSEEKAATLF